MNFRRRPAVLLATVIATMVMAAGSRSDELVVFHGIPSEYEWRAVQAYFHDGEPDYMQTLRLDTPLAQRDFYQLPDDVTLDLDHDGVDERVLAIGHPEACDQEGCDVFLLEGDLHDLRIDSRLHLPLKVFGSTAIVFFGDDFLFLRHSRADMLLSGEVGRESLWSVIERIYGEIELERLDPQDMAFASIDLNGDWRAEVFLMTTSSGLCGRGGCSTLLTPHPDDASGDYPWRWTWIAPFENFWRRDMEFYVSPHMVRGWRVIRVGSGCYVWHGDRYAWFSHTTFRQIPVQGCFE